jgi:hypothetical protein
MSITPGRLRLYLVAAAALFLAVALGIRAVSGGHLDNTAPLAQYSGTALYASMVYAGVVFVRPRIAPLPAGAIAIGFCWLVECLQLTGVPADLSEHSLIARLVLGRQFDLTDIAWYPAGVIPLVAVHLLLRDRLRS